MLSSLNALPAALVFLSSTFAAPGPDKEPAIQEPALREELLAMEQEDVELRNSVVKQLGENGVPFGGDKPITDPALVKTLTEPARKLAAMDKKHRTRLQAIVKKYGWPGKSLVGTDGAHAAWLVVQHSKADLAFQQRCLKLMKAAPKGEVALPDIAYLTDCVLIAQKKKQLYGTQLQVVKGAFKPRPIEDPANVDKRRAAMGLSTLAEYLEVSQGGYDKSAEKKK
jgi:hypothetical protein